MSVQRRIGGLPLAVYVVALLLLPLTAVGMFSLREFDRNNESADHASQVAEAVALGSIAASGLVPAESELIASLANLAGSPFPELDPEGVLAATGPRLRAVDGRSIDAGTPLEDAGSIDAVVTDPPYGIGKGWDKEVVGRNGKSRLWGNGKNHWDTTTVSDDIIASLSLYPAIIWGGNFLAIRGCTSARVTRAWPA